MLKFKAAKPKKTARVEVTVNTSDNVVALMLVGGTAVVAKAVIDNLAIFALGVMDNHHEEKMATKTIKRKKNEEE